MADENNVYALELVTLDHETSVWGFINYFHLHIKFDPSLVCFSR